MRIIEAKVEEASELSEFLRRVVYDHLRDVDEEKAQGLASRYSIEMLKDRIKSSRVWIARKAGRIVGTVTLDDFEIKGLYVDRTSRRQGVGRRLLDAVMQSARDSGLREVVVETNEIAKLFFESNGFAVAEKRKKEGKRGTYYWYKLRKSVN